MLLEVVLEVEHRTAKRRGCCTYAGGAPSSCRTEMLAKAMLSHAKGRCAGGATGGVGSAARGFAGGGARRCWTVSLDGFQHFSSPPPASKLKKNLVDITSL